MPGWCTQPPRSLQYPGPSKSPSPQVAIHLHRRWDAVLIIIQRFSRLNWLVEFIAKFLQFQPEVQHKILIADVSTTVL